MNNVVLVTGSSRGIGKATIIEFAKKNYNVVINYLNSKNDALALQSYIIENFDVQVLVIKADVSNETDVKNMIDEIITKFERLDVVVNNAGVAIDTTIEDKTKENFLKILNTNLIGTFLVSREALKHMQKGAIINVSSTNALNTYYDYSLDYDASKAGVISLTHNLSKYAAKKVRVNAVAPGWVNTEMNKELDEEFKKSECAKIYEGRFAEKEEIAKVIVFLASDDASYINNTVVRIDGGSDHE